MTRVLTRRNLKLCSQGLATPPPPITFQALSVFASLPMWFRTSHREPVYTTFHFHTTQRTPLWPGTCCHQAPCAVTSEVISILPLRASCVQAPSGGICLVVWKSTTGGFPLCYKHSDRIEVVIYESYQKGTRGSIRNSGSLVCDVH